MLAKVFRSIFSLKPQQASDRSISSGERQSPKSLTPDLLKMLEKGDEDALRYPPYIRGFPAFISGSVLLDYHKDKVGLIASGIGLPPRQFNELILPVLTSYADFVHLVPASQNHHHRAWGGLLAHGLEVALMALNTCQTTSFDHGRVPQDRTRRKERWYAAAVFASLLHDTGKPLSDFKITDESGEISWKPVSKSIPEWAREVGIERYYLHWNPGRHERHKNLSITMVDRILNPDVREWLMDGGQDLYSAMVAAITGENEKSTLTGIIIKSDSQSVAQDLKKHGGDPAGAAVGGTGVPIASQVINAMRLLRQNEVWTANERGARIWSTTQGIFIAWNAAVSEVVEKMLADGLKAFPRSADSLGEILADHDVFERNPNGSGSIYWKVAPDILSVGKDKVLRLQCVKLSSPSTLYPFDPLPPPVAVEIGDDKSAVRYDPANGGMGLAIGEVGEGGAIDLAAEVSADITAADDKPMFDLDGGVTEPLQAAPAPGGFSAPALANKPVAGVDAKKGKQGSSPSLVREPEPQPKPGLVIGAPAPTLAPASKSDTTEDRGAKLGAPGSSLFAGIKIGADAPEFEEEEKAQPMQHQAAVWDDPFAATEHQLDGDPFSSAPAARTPQAATPSDKRSDAKAGAAQPKRQPTPDVNPTETPKILSSMPGLQIGTKAPAPLRAAEEEARNNSLERSGSSPSGFETVEITGDFDPEILEMAGIEQAFAEVPVKAAEANHEDTSSVEAPRVSPAQKAALMCEPANHGKPAALRKVDFVPIPVEAFEDEFRFDAEHAVLDAFDVPAPPIRSPLGISAPEELSGLDLSSFSLQEAPQDVSLHGFDLPSLDANVFIGGTPAQPIVQLGAIEDLECDEVHAGDPVEQLSAAGGGADGAELERPDAPSKRRRRKKKKKDGFVVPMPPMDLGAPVATAPMPGINIGPARKPKATPQPLVKSCDIAPPIRQGIELNEPVRLPQSTYQAFLNRHPELAAKFLWYAENVGTAIRLYKRHHPLFLFKEGGFQPEDVAALNEAHWLWFDLTSPERLVYSANGDKGVVLITYLVDALAEFSEGKFNIGVSRPESSLSDDEMGRIARSAIERVAVNTESYATPVVVFTPKLVTSICGELGIREPDLIRALIETQQMVLDRKNYIVSVEARAVSYE